MEVEHKIPSPHAIETLRKAIARVKAFPTEFNMSFWARDLRSVLSISTFFNETNPLLEQPPPCNTIGCLAFEVCVVDGNDPRDLLRNENLTAFYIYSKASEILGLTGEDAVVGINCRDEVVGIFSVDLWPAKLRGQYYATEVYSLERALVLERAVEEWIANDGTFLA
jgi:hypothetical protein